MPRAKSKKEEPQEASEDDMVMQDPPTSHQPSMEDTNDDASMAKPEFEDDVVEEEEEIQRIRTLPGSTPTAASFEFLEEGHTLGNALRYVIMKNPEVEFCAYAIPHPSEAKMNMRIQTYPGTLAIDALKKGLKDLQEYCDVVTETFIKARDEFDARMST